MGIIRPAKLKGDIIVYTKWCIECEHPEWLIAINAYAMHNDLDVQVIRTQYHPADHKKASELWGGEDYSTFVLADGVHTMKEYLEMISDTKNKLVKRGKTKDDVQRLPKAKRSTRKNRVAVAAAQTETEVEGQEAL